MLTATTASAAPPVTTEFPQQATPAATPCEVEFDQHGMAWIQEATRSHGLIRAPSR